MTRNLPSSASVAHATEGAKLHAAAAARNEADIAALLVEVAPKTGKALELASGTGQHVARFARDMPGLIWQPTEVDAARRASIDAYVADADLDTLRPARALDACAPGWAAQWGGQNLIVLVNLLHLISWSEAECLLENAGSALAQGGRLVLYGPFKRNGELTSQGDAAFDAQLRGADPDIGYKDDTVVIAALQDCGLQLLRAVELPANNLALVAGQP
ncbi:MAG: DUF938 domain-containing protein [Pseudomonadota bacterium]